MNKISIFFGCAVFFLIALSGYVFIYSDHFDTYYGQPKDLKDELTRGDRVVEVDVIEVEISGGEGGGAMESGGIDSVQEQAANEIIKETADAVAGSKIAVLTNASCGSAISVVRQVSLRLINEVRSQSRQCGDDFFAAAPPIAWSERLASAAQKHSDDMVQGDFFSHDGSDGSDLGQRVRSVGYHYRVIGENIAAGQLTVDEAVDGWVGSPGHCANLMNPQFKEVGIACTQDGSTEFGQYWTMVLAEGSW